MTTVRASGFWALDALRGGGVRAAANAISASLRDDDGREQQATRLDELLAHATSHVPFYRNLAGPTGLADFPVVDKAVILERVDDFVAEGVDRTRLGVATTGGSTGTPFRVYQDAIKTQWRQADAISWGRRAGYELGRPLYHLKIWTQRNRMSRSTQFLRNVRPLDVTALDDAALRRMLERMAGQRTRVGIIAYASVLIAIARMLEASGGEPLVLPRAAAVIGQSEALPAPVRERLKRSLGGGVVSRYGMEEVGIIGQQDVDGADGAFRVNHATQMVEILREDDDQPAAPGELGRIVVTDLINRAQPMIRYDTGDLGAFALAADGRADERWLAQVEGRRLDRIYDVHDQPVSSWVMYRIWWRYPDVRQYQLVQRGRGDYLLRLNVADEFDRVDALVADFRACMGQDAAVDVEFTREQLVLASGKRQSVVSRYEPGSGHGDRRLE